MKSDQDFQAYLDSKGLTGPRVTAQDVEDTIAETDFFYHGSLTLCVITTRNGFKVVGESACACEENYDKDVGEDVSKQDAKNKLWALEGYLLKERLSYGK